VRFEWYQIHCVAVAVAMAGWQSRFLFYFVKILAVLGGSVCNYSSCGMGSGSGRVAVTPIDRRDQRGSNGTRQTVWLWLWRWLGGSKVWL
jgi:hypothetical protein